MKQVQKTIGRWIQRIAGKTRTDAPAQPTRRPLELDAQSLREVSGGTTESPNKNW